MLLLKNSILILLFTVGLNFWGPLVFAQNSNIDSTHSETSQESNSSDEMHDTQKLNKVLEDYNKNQVKASKDAATIEDLKNNAEKSESDLDLDTATQTVKTNNEGLFQDAFGKLKRGQDKKLRDVTYSQAVKLSLTPLQKLSNDELRSMLKEAMKESKLRVFFETYPKLSDLTVSLIKDKEAIPSLVKITEDQNKLIHFLGLMLSTVFVGYLIKQFTKKEGRTIFEALLFWLMRFLVVNSLRLGIIFYFYGPEITPFMKVLNLTFWNTANTFI